MHYAWLIWSLLFLVLWAVLYFSSRNKESKKEMLIVSFWTSLTGLTEPFFVPEYWKPLTLFDLAQRTGFDLESFIFAFAVGGIAVVIYEWFFRGKLEHRMVSPVEKSAPRHKYHLLALSSLPILFFSFLIFTDWNPIYSAIVAMMGAGFFSWYCRPDLKKKMLASALTFLGLYFLYFLTLIALYPGYVEKVWNLSVISGILILGIPLEELMFAFSFGFMWSSTYEHFTWRKIKVERT